MHATKNITSLSKVTITSTSGIIQYTLAEVHLFKCFIMHVELSEPADLLGVLLRSQGLKRENYPVSGSFMSKNARGQRRMARLLWADRKTMVTFYRQGMQKSICECTAL